MARPRLRVKQARAAEVRSTNRTLLAGVTLAFVTGVLAFGAGTAWGGPVVAAHGIAGLVLVGLAGSKVRIARPPLAARRVGWPASLVLTVVAVVAVGFGVVHGLGARRLPAGLTSMQVHVVAGLGLMLFTIGHARVRPLPGARRPAGPIVARRQVLAGGAAGLLWLATDRLGPGADRRFTGSHEVGSFDPDRMPVTQWLDDSVRHIDAADWRLRVAGNDGQERILRFADIDGDDEVVATLDCTGGWQATQRWRGMRLDRVLGRVPSGGSVLVRSATGYTRRLPARDVPHLLLATRVGGAPLTAGHGAPARLVAPGRRGFWWVKWVDSITVDEDRPWWWQPPFPLT